MDYFVYIGMALMVVMFLSGAPLAIAFAFGSSIIALFSMGMSFEALAQIFFSSINSYPLLACPFFILAGNLILRSGAMLPLSDFVKSTFGTLPGGLAVAGIIFAAFLGSISGSAAACLAIIGTVMVPIFVENGYDRPFAAGLAVTSAELGLLIPPSLFFIIFGALNRISIVDLFMGGVGMGLLTAFFMCIVAVVISKKRKYATMPKSSWKVKRQAFIKVLPLIFMPVIVLGGIYGGFFSPTQAASVATLYSLLIGLFVYGELDFEGIKEATIDTAKISSMIYFLIIGSDLMGRMFAYIELPQMITEYVAAMELGPLGFLFMVNAVLLVMGFFFSSLPMVIIVLPLFIPSVISLGIDPVFYGVLAVTNSLIGEITPPMGPQLWIAAPVCKEKMGAIAREAWPFLGAWVAAMITATIFPDIVMYLVRMFR
ncbi:MAG: TRAP transporter large permease [Desulfobacteraceae bacterium]|nr:TRAP transporter large permease [Desulfobacteraceae bacterium]